MCAHRAQAAHGIAPLHVACANFYAVYGQPRVRAFDRSRAGVRSPRRTPRSPLDEGDAAPASAWLEAAGAIVDALLVAGADTGVVDAQARAGGGGPRFAPLHWALVAGLGRGVGNVRITDSFGGASDDGLDEAVELYDRPGEELAWKLLRAGACVHPVRPCVAGGGACRRSRARA